MPKIEFKLKDPKYCNGCPMLSEHDYCNVTLTILYLEQGTVKIKRPQSCIDKFGE